MHLGGRWRAALRISPLEGVLCFKRLRGCRGSKDKSNGRMWKRWQPGDHSIFIDVPPTGGSNKHGNFLNKCTA